MIRIIKPRRRVVVTERQIIFDDLKVKGAAFGFPCNGDFVVDREALNPVARANYDRLIADRFDGRYAEPRREEWTRSFYEPAVGRCSCGRAVTLEGDSSCRCGREYNAVGQELAPRSQWGEETGESFGARRDW